MEVHLRVVQRIDAAAGVAVVHDLGDLAHLGLEALATQLMTATASSVSLPCQSADQLAVGGKVDQPVALLVSQFGGRPEQDARILARGSSSLCRRSAPTGLVLM